MRKFYFLKMLLLVVAFAGCSLDTEKDIDYSIDPLEPADEAVVLVTLPSGQVVKRVEENYLWQGDILLSKSDFESLSEKGYIENVVNEKTNLIDLYKGIDPITHLPLYLSEKGEENSLPIAASIGVLPYLGKTWRIVRYEYAPDLTQDRKQIAYEAILHWEKNTNVRFLNANNIKEKRHPRFGDYPCVIFTNSNKNNSNVGMQGGRQVINLASNQPVRVAIHEIGHAIGLFHEHCSKDRDKYININYGNLKPEAHHNFSIPSRYTGILPANSIDFHSIMIYGSYTSDTKMVYDTNKPVMTKKDGSTWNAPQVLSNFDKMWANTYYLPLIPRSDSYIELENIIYKPDNTIMSQYERLQLQASLNNGYSTPPPGGRIVNKHSPY